MHVVLGNDVHHIQLNLNVHARRSTEAHAANAMAPLRSMTGFAGNFENMTGEDDEPAKVSHAIAKAIDNMMMMIKAQTSDLDMSGPDRSFTSFRPLYLSSTSLLPLSRDPIRWQMILNDLPTQPKGLLPPAP